MATDTRAAHGEELNRLIPPIVRSFVAKSVHIVVPDAGRTQAYRSIQFENGHGSDVTAPSLTVTLTPDTLWPANHKLMPVTANVQVSDDTDPNPSVTLVSVTSSEPDNGLGDGDTPNDVQGAARL